MPATSADAWKGVKKTPLNAKAAAAVQTARETRERASTAAAEAAQTAAEADAMQVEGANPAMVEIQVTLALLCPALPCLAPALPCLSIRVDLTWR